MTAENPMMRTRLWALPACLMLLVTPAYPQNAVTAADPASEKLKPRSAAEQRRARVNDTYIQRRYDGPTPEVIYGDDDRRDVYEVSDPFLLGLAESVCAVLDASELVDNGDGTYTLLATRWTQVGGIGLCPDEPFRGQYQVGFCSGFLVGRDLIATAGHCVSSFDCGPNPVAFVFGFDQLGPQSDPLLTVPAENVYFCDAMVDHALGGELDHSVVRVDRPVDGRNPLPIRYEGAVTGGEPLVMIGHTIDLPKKIDDGGQVQDANGETAFFLANVDAYGGSSGSPVFSSATGVVEGILARGNPDWVFGACVQSNQCLDGGCPGWEEISKTISFAASVPPLSLLVLPVGDVLHIGRVGGPFDPAEVTYRLSNANSEPIDYEVTLQTGGNAPLLINGESGPISGTVDPGGPDATIVITIDPLANLLPADLYTTVIEFEDLTNSVSTLRRHTLEIGQTGFEVSPADDFHSTGPEGGPFPGVQTYTITSTRPAPVGIRITADSDWISLDGEGGPLTVLLTGIGDFIEVEVGFSEPANLLELGLHEGQVDFENLVGGAGDTSRAVELDVGRFAYPSVDTPIAIDDNTEIISLIEVEDVYCIGDVDVEINVTHTFIGDLIIELEAPGGGVVRLHDRSGGSAENIHVTYDDLTRPPDGPGILADFNGELVTGVWTLRVSDNAGLDTGSLDSWTLRVAAGQPTCPPVARDLTLALSSNRSHEIRLDAVTARGTSLDYIIGTLPALGALSDPNGEAITIVPHTLADGGDTVVYDPDPDFAGLDGFAYSARDGMSSNTADVNLTVGTRLRSMFFGMDSEPDPPWTTVGQWAFGRPSGGGGQQGGPDPDRGHTGENVYGYNLDGDYANNMSETHLTTSSLDFTGMSGTTLRFRRWLGVEQPQYDRAYLRVSNDEQEWVTIWQNERKVADVDWQLVEYDISAVADNQSTVFIRWTIGTTDSSFVYCGWNIDDVEIRALTLSTLGDINCDDELNAFDIEPFLLALFDPGQYAIQYPDCDLNLADINGDGAVNAFDIEPFVNLLFGP